jgi:ornithine cyclodeaminase/alanine dehydrogenase-like protein (mu-crystallin family)
MPSFPRLELRLGGYFFVYRMECVMDEDRYYNLGSHDKLFNQIDELTDALETCDAVVSVLRNDVKILLDAVVKAAAHVKPTCGDLYEELIQALDAIKHHDRS